MQATGYAKPKGFPNIPHTCAYLHICATHLLQLNDALRALQGTQDLWTFYADSAVAFEKRMSILRGIYIDDSQMDHDG